MILAPHEPKQSSEMAFDGQPERRLPGPSRPQGRRGANTLKFVRTLRGDGVLLSEGVEAPVSYSLDVFESGMGRTGSGVVEGDLGERFAGGAGRLRLESGEEFALTLQDVDEAGASFETRSAPRGG